jgi:hypothetical protein
MGDAVSASAGGTAGLAETNDGSVSGGFVDGGDGFHDLHFDRALERAKLGDEVAVEPRELRDLRRNARNAVQRLLVVVSSQHGVASSLSLLTLERSIEDVRFAADKVDESLCALYAALLARGVR